MKTPLFSKYVLSSTIFSGASLVALCATAQYAQAQTNVPPVAVTNAPPPSLWEASVTLGATVTSGNSDSSLVTLTGRADKKWLKNELHFGIDGAYGEADDEKNNESIKAFAQYNRLFTERFYGYGRADGLHDAIADVEYRFTVGPGVGYYIIKDQATTLSVEGGPGVVFEKQGHDNHNYFTLRFAEKFEHNFSDRVRVWEMVEILPQIDNFENFIVNSEIGVESSLSKAWALTIVLQDTYDNEPAPGRKENDLKFIAGIKWKLLH